MNDEVREAKHIKMKPSIVRKAHQKAKEEKLAREKAEEKHS